jgi:two-component system response regulator AlgR
MNTIAPPALRVLIVDDEDLARLRLRSLLGDCLQPPAEVVGECATAPAALQWLTQHPVDVVMLDIHMPGLDGLQLAQRLRQLPRPPLVVFITAHAEHALSAFELDAVDYLTKPVRRARLQEALARAAHRLGRVTPASAPPASDEPVIIVNDRGRVIRVPVSEVLYLKAELKYVTLRTAHHSHVLDDSLTDLEQRLGERFLRVHRNAIVAKRAVRALERRADEEGDSEGWVVRVAPTDEWLQVSRRQVAAVREALAAEGL